MFLFLFIGSNGSNMLRLPLTVIQCQCRNLSYMVCPGRFTPLLFLGMLTRGGVYSFRFFHPVDTSAQLEFSIRYMELRLQNIGADCRALMLSPSFSAKSLNSDS